MKKIALPIFFCLSLLSTGFAQNCIPDTLTLSSQQDIDDFPINFPTCTNIEGTLIISAPDLINLDGLNQLLSIQQELIFTNNTFTDFSLLELPFLVPGSSGVVRFVNNPLLSNMAGIQLYLEGKFQTVIIENNPALTDMTGFDSDGDITEPITLRMANNPQLISLDGMQNLFLLTGTLQIDGNPLLTTLEGLNNIFVFERLELRNNPSLTNLSALSQLTTFDKGLVIDNCDALINFSGLDNLVTIGDGELRIENNNALTDLSGLQNLSNVVSLFIHNNPNLSTLIHLNDLSIVTESFELFNCPVLQNLDGLEGITQLQENFLLEDLTNISDLQGLSQLELVGNNFKIENINLSISNLSDLENLRTINGNLEIFNTGFITLSGLDSIKTIGGRLYLSQNDELTSVAALSNLTDIGDNLLALRFNDILSSLQGLHNIDPNSIDSLNLVNNDELSFCSMPNICSFLANYNNSSNFEISGNATDCSDIANLVFNCAIVDPIVTGTIYFDDNLNCINDGETSVNDAILVFENGGTSIYVSSGNDGVYLLSIPVGTYNVSVINFDPALWTVCNNGVEIMVEENQQLDLDLGLSSLILCPKLNIDVSGGSLLACEEVEFEVIFCNEGTTAASNIEVDIQLSEGFTFLGSSITPTFNGSLYTFAIPDDLAINDCASFQFNAVYDADCNSYVSGQTACVTAQIRPDDFCIPSSPSWDGSSISVSSFCDGDTIRYQITNTGVQDMTNTTKYIIIEDNIMISDGNTGELEAAEFIELRVASSGATVRLETEQVADHPGVSIPNVTVEACDPDGGNDFSIGYYRQYPQDDINPFIDIECMDVLESPYLNTRTADPLGIAEAHCLQKNIPIEYTLHFQNTGTGNAALVIVQDTLSPLLDIGSIKAGSASHAYDFEIIGEGIAQFTFANINLPDSSANPAASRGYVSYKISQKAGNPVGAIIENGLAIFMDTTSATVVDTVFHMVSQSYCIDTMLINQTAELYLPDLFRITPNPFSDFCIFEWTAEHLAPQGQLLIYDVRGQVVRQIAITKKRTVIQRAELPSGVYFYELQSDTGGVWTQGKLVVMGW